MPNISGSVIKYSSDTFYVANLSCIMHLKVYNQQNSVKVLRSNTSIPKFIAIKTFGWCQQWFEVKIGNRGTTERKSWLSNCCWLEQNQL